MIQKPLDIEETVKFATYRGILPARVRDCAYDYVLFTRAVHDNLEMISWDTFESVLDKRDLQVYDCEGYLKIMRKRMAEAVEMPPGFILISAEPDQINKGSRPADSFVDSLDNELRHILDTSVNKNSEVLKALSK